LSLTNIMEIIFSFIFLLAHSQGNFLQDPQCPDVIPKSPQQCKGKLSNCWSPGVRDTDCPKHGLCCYDGCANTCVSQHQSQPSIQHTVAVSPPVQYLPAEQAPEQYTEYIPVQEPPLQYLPVQEPPQQYIPLSPPQTTPRPTTPPPTTPPQTTPRPTTPPPTTPRPTTVRPTTRRPSIPVYSVPAPLASDPSSTFHCPSVSPLPVSQCSGQFSTCWSVGVPDLDCYDWNLCCFDGCANTCLGDSPLQTPAPRFEPEPPRNPCSPSPCHVSAMCVPQEGLPMCKCRSGHIPDREEPHPEVKCSLPEPHKETDPCQPNPCGVLHPGTTQCTVNIQGNPVCRCLPGLIPMPDTITGCGPRPDPCLPNPCGPGALPLNQGSECSCSCPSGWVGDGHTGCYRGECLVDDDCSQDKACSQYYCVDPCQLGMCSNSHFCRVMSHRPICGFNEEPRPSVREESFVIGERYQPHSPAGEDSSIVIGEREVPSVTDNRMMMMMDTSNLPVIGIGSGKKIQSRIRRRRQRKLGRKEKLI